MSIKNLPIGLQTFSKLIEDNCYYVDKTALIAKLAKKGQCYFLSRPRRFGKSLLLSTLKSAFAGEEHLFKGLYLAEHWDWSQKHAVIHLSFGGGIATSVKALHELFQFSLNRNAYLHNVTLTQESSSNRFAELIQRLYDQSGLPVVVLVDEYDKPILDNLEKEEAALLIREEMRNIYSVLKENDAYLKFVFLTGVSKFSKINLFSGLNNLKDISLDSEYATLCGYTEKEIKQVFTDRIDGVDFKQLANWYNGYNFLGEKVYNPFGILLYLEKQQFKNYWFETGSPSFLLKLVRERQYKIPDIENILLSESDLGSFDINDVTLETVLFQTGYLTIKAVEEIDGERFFYLSYPNREVKSSLNQYLLRDLTHTTPSSIARNRFDIYKALQVADFQRLEQGFKSLFSSIPTDWYRKNNIAHYEGYYASIVYSCFCASGLTVIAEDTTNHGRIDLTVIQKNKVFIIEFKVLDENSRRGTALAQIKTKNYQQKYLKTDRQVFLIGMEFDKQQRNLCVFEVECL